MRDEEQRPGVEEGTGSHVEVAGEGAAGESEPGEGADVEVALVLPAAVSESVLTEPPATPRAVAEEVAAPGGGGEAGGEAGAGVALTGAVLERLDALEAAVARRLDELQTRFDREIRAEATREKVVDRLHAELQEYKQDLLLNTLRPVFIDLIQLHDDIGKLVGASGEPTVSAERFGELLRGFQQAIEDILYRQGVESYRAEGEQFDARRQRAVATVTAEDASLARTVAARLRPGFRAGEKVIRPEIVSVYTTAR